MTFDLNDYTVAEKYDLLKQVINIAAKLLGEREVTDDHKSTRKKDEHQFSETDGHVNLLGVRGMKNGNVVTDDVNMYDDTLFIIYQKGGIKKVKEYRFATDSAELDDEDEKVSAHLIEGQHRYVLGSHHHKSPEYCNLNDIITVYESSSLDRKRSREKSKDWDKWEPLWLGEGSPLDFDTDFYSHQKNENDDNKYAYRALVPEDGVVVRREYGGGSEDDRFLGKLSDAERENQYGDIEVEGYDPDQPAINIHHASYSGKPNSAGCQTIPGWNNHREAMMTIERDFSIKTDPQTNRSEGSRDTTEKPPGPYQLRPAIYTLVTGYFVRNIALAKDLFETTLPFWEANKSVGKRVKYKSSTVVNVEEISEYMKNKNR